MKTIPMTLCFIHQHPRILLGMKKRGLGKDKWNGFGGKVEIETAEDAVRREVAEECGVVVKDLEKVGILDFAWQGNPETLQVHVFKAGSFSGEPVETEEMKPKWFFADEIPFSDMWQDDVYWMPMLLSGRKFHGRFVLDGDNQLIEKEIEELETI